jgi:hypothetical protein
MGRILIDIEESRTGEVLHDDLIPLSEAHEFCLNRGWVHDSTMKTAKTTSDNDTIYKFLVYTPETPAEHERFKFQKDQLKTWENRVSMRRGLCK